MNIFAAYLLIAFVCGLAMVLGSPVGAAATAGFVVAGVLTLGALL